MQNSTNPLSAKYFFFATLSNQVKCFASFFAREATCYRSKGRNLRPQNEWCSFSKCAVYGAIVRESPRKAGYRRSDKAYRKSRNLKKVRAKC